MSSLVILKNVTEETYVFPNGIHITLLRYDKGIDSPTLLEKDIVEATKELGPQEDGKWVFHVLAEDQYLFDELVEKNIFIKVEKDVK